MKRKVLVLDIGGTRVKLLMSLRDERVFASGPRMRPEQLIAKLKESTRGWRFDMASIGFPRARAQGTHRKRSETFGQRVGWFQFCQSPRRTDTP